MTKKRIQKEEKMKKSPTFGRPTLFGRPTSEARSYGAAMTLITEGLRNSDEFRTSDTTDVRHGTGRPTSARRMATSVSRRPPKPKTNFRRMTDVRHEGPRGELPIQDTSPPESDFRHVSDVRRDGRPKPIGRPKLPARRSDGLRPCIRV